MVLWMVYAVCICFCVFKEGKRNEINEEVVLLIGTSTTKGFLIREFEVRFPLASKAMLFQSLEGAYQNNVE